MVRIAGSHPAGPGSIPGAGIIILKNVSMKYIFLTVFNKHCSKMGFALFLSFLIDSA